MPDVSLPGYEVHDVGALQHRIEELLADNDSLQMHLWTMHGAMQAMAEKIDELEAGR